MSSYCEILEGQLCAEDCLLAQLIERPLTRKQTRRLDNSAATGDPKQPFTYWRNRVDQIYPNDQTVLVCEFTLNRMEANHVYCRYGKERLQC